MGDGEKRRPRPREPRGVAAKRDGRNDKWHFSAVGRAITRRLSLEITKIAPHRLLTKLTARGMAAIFCRGARWPGGVPARGGREAAAPASAAHVIAADARLMTSISSPYSESRRRRGAHHAEHPLSTGVTRLARALGRGSYSIKLICHRPGTFTAARVKSMLRHETLVLEAST